ncbi:T9SS type A sorting domain-containing protein [Maribacter sp.]
MKRKLLVGTLLLFSVWAGAQTIDIDDPAFEDALIDLGYDSNVNRNGSISVSDADLIVDLDVSNRGISSLSGLEFFSAVETLDVSGNDLDELVLQNISLITITADGCNLADKDILFKNEITNARLTNVINLSLNDNGISGNNGVIGFGGVENVRFLSIQGNNFETINLKNTTNIELMEADNCPNLSVLNDLDGLQSLTGLTLPNCAFTALDVTDNAALQSLNVSSNAQLRTLNIANGNNAALTTLNTQGTALACIQVDDPIQADNALGWQKDAQTSYAINCDATNNMVDISLSLPNPADEVRDNEGNFVISSGTLKILVNYDLKDENGAELTTSTLNEYQLEISTIPHPTKNPATGGPVVGDGIDFELITAKPVTGIPALGGADGDSEVAIGGDKDFEADEFFLVEVRSNDPNITLKNASNGVVQLPVRIIDNEITNINLEVIQNGAEPNQKAKLRITSTFQNNPRTNETGAPMPFTIVLNDGSAIVDQDYEPLDNSRIEIPNGESSKEFEIIINNNDDQPEEEEAFFANISYAGNIPSNRVNIQVGAQGIEVPIVDDGDVNNTPYVVTATIIGAGTGPDYSIEEGQTFNLNFNASGATNLTYDPVITVTKDGLETMEDFTITGLDQIFTISDANPDGSISFTAKDDGTPEGEKTYVITIVSEDPNTYTLSNPFTFEVTVKDKTINPSGPFTVETYLSGLAGSGPYYELEEGTTFNLNINADENASPGVSYELKISYETYSIGESDTDIEVDVDLFIPNERKVQEKGDVDLQNENAQGLYQFAANPNDIDGQLSFTIVEDGIVERTEELIITITSQLNNVQLTTQTFIIKIKPGDPVKITPSLEGAGTSTNYSITEGETFYLVAEILEETDLFYPVAVDFNTGTAIKANIFREKNSDFGIGDDDVSIYAQTDRDDFRLPITVYLDDVSEGQETIIIRLLQPKADYVWSNQDDNGEVEFTITIENKEFAAEAKINGINTDNNGIYEVEEGQSFDLEINALGLDPNLALSLKPIKIEVEGSSADLGVDFDSSLEVGFDQSNNILDFQTIVDGIPENTELIQLTLPRPPGGFTWQNANADDSYSIIIKLLDKPFTGPKDDFKLSLRASIYDFVNDDEETRPLTPVNDIYTIKDNEELILSIEGANTSQLAKGIKFSFIDGTANLGKDYFPYGIESANTAISEVYTNRLSKWVTFKPIPINEVNKSFSIRIEPTTNNYNLRGANDEIIDYLETLDIAVEIESSGTSDTQIITTSVSGATLNPTNQDAIVKEYLAKEGDTVFISLNALKENRNQGAIYNMDFVIDEKSTLTPDDYILRIEDSNGNDMQGNLSNYTVDNNKDFDARIMVSLKDDGLPETREELNIRLIPEASFGETGDLFAGGTRFADAQEGDILEYTIVIDEPTVAERVYLELSNTGGLEGSLKPDVITCSLLDGQGQPYTGHTSPIEIPFKIIDFEVSALSITQDEYKLSSNSFSFAPGESTTTVEATYYDEINEKGEPDANDIDCDYYYIRLNQPTQSANANIVLNKEDYLIKIADKSEFLVFVDLDLSNVKPVVRNRHPDDSYADGSIERDCRTCIDSYIVEEGSTLKFTIDAAKPVERGSNYTVNLRITGSKPFDAIKDIDIIDFGDQLKREIFVKDDAVDQSVEIEIKPDGEEENEPESFSVTFNDNNDKRYRFSKRDARSYNNSFNIKIIDAIPARVQKSTAYNSLSEEEADSNYGALTIVLDKPAGEQPLLVEFNLLGKAELGSTKDYIIQSNNNLQFDGQKGGVYFTQGQSSVELRFIANDDTFDEETEDIRLQLIDGFGYSLSGAQSEVLTVEDNDTSDLKATLSKETLTLYENRNEVFEETIDIILDNSNTTRKDLKINLKVNTDNPNVFLNDDFRLYEVLDGSEPRPLTTLNDLYVTIPVSKDRATLRIEALTDNEDTEGNERFNLVLSEGEDYAPTEPKTTIVTIIDDSDNISSNSDQITAKVISSACEGINRGGIVLINPTKYQYTVLLFNSGERVDQQTLTDFQTNENKTLFSGLAPGEYEVYLEYKLSTNQVVPTQNPPSFSLEVRTADETILLSSQVLNLKTGQLIVSGSDSYTIFNNGERYVYNIGGVEPVKLDVPLHNGLNEISIKGTSECQSPLKVTLFAGSIKNYPNPTKDLIYLAGFKTNSSVQVMLTNTSGKLVLQTNFEVSSEVLAIDLTGFAPGMYLGQIQLEDGQIVPIKILKK